MKKKDNSDSNNNINNNDNNIKNNNNNNNNNKNNSKNNNKEIKLNRSSYSLASKYIKISLAQFLQTAVVFYLYKQH